MKKTIWLMVILFVMAGGIYSYVFFSNRLVTRASSTPSCCSEVNAVPVQGCGMESSCGIDCTSTVPSCPSLSETSVPVNKLSKETKTEPCEECVCGTGVECPYEDKCAACLEEEKTEQKTNQGVNNPGNGSNGNGNGSQGKHRNGK